MARWRGTNETGPYTPAAGARQADRLLAGLQRQRGLGGALVRVAALVVLLVIVALLVASAARSL